MRGLTGWAGTARLVLTHRPGGPGPLSLFERFIMTETHVTLTTAQLVSLGDGRLACDFGEVMEGVCEILGDPGISTIGMIAAGKFIQPRLLKEFPWLANLPEMPDLTDVGTEERRKIVFDWVDRIGVLYGKEHKVPFMGEDWNKRSLLDDLNDLAIIRGK